jgi:solute carrier family 6 GABA transporter-like protein 1
MAGIWADAAGQIFFSIGVCMGIMTSYGSYNPVKKPIIMDNMIICISNSLLSFISGFAVWSIVGYLNEIGSMAQSKTSGTGLVFVAYPSAIDTMNAPNFWMILLGLTLFMLGIDSAFSMVEATATVINDTKWGQQYPKSFVAFCLCILGFLLSIPFCTNWGYILFDSVDHYLGNFLLIIVGIMQCFGCGWIFDYENTLEKSIGHKKSLTYLNYTYWGLLAVIGTVFPILGKTYIGIPVFIGCLVLISLIPSFMMSKLSFGEWYNEIAMCGVRKLAYSMTMLGRNNEKVKEWYEPFFVFYWGFCVKYLIPTTLWFILIGKTIADIKDPYGGYSTKWQVFGILVPLVGLVAFLVSLCVNVYEEPFDKAQFEDAMMGVEAANVSQTKVQDESKGHVEMVETNTNTNQEKVAQVAE